MEKLQLVGRKSVAHHSAGLFPPQLSIRTIDNFNTRGDMRAKLGDNSIEKLGGEVRGSHL